MRARVDELLPRLEDDLRALALVALAAWQRTGVAAHELFPAVSALQRPSYGSWNGVLLAVRAARKAALRGERRDAVERVTVLRELFELLERPVRAEPFASLPSLVRWKVGRQPRVADLVTAPVIIRNRSVHDAPSDPAWWSAVTGALEALAEQEAAIVGPFLAAAERPAPWFVDGRAFNGISDDFEVTYASPARAPIHVPASHELLAAMQALLGKADLRERDFQRLLRRLAPDDAKGVIVGDYFVGRPIAEGGFATVHTGIQLATGRKVAIKLLRDGLPEDARARFQQEAAFLSRVDHDNIVGVIGCGEDPWTESAKTRGLARGEAWFDQLARGAAIKTYLVLEWIDGETLETIFGRVRDGRGPARETITGWFIQAARAMSAVHAAGLIHRDLKPSNLMIDADGELKVMDFGIARLQSDDRTLVTTVGTALGTPAYMPPEQLAAREDAELGPTADVYALCATFYELYTGARVFAHDREAPDTVATRKRQGIGPERPRRLVRTLSWELDSILLAGLEADPSHRYRTMEDLARDLVAAAANQPIVHRRPSLWRRSRLAYRRNRAVANIAGGFGALALGGVIAYILNIRAEQAATEAARQDAVAESARADEQRDHAVAETRRAETALAAEAEQRRRAEDNERRATTAEQAERAQRLEAERLATAERAQRVRADHESQLAFGTSASLLSRENGRELEALALGVKAVAPSWHAGVDPPVDGLRGLQDALARTRTWGLALPSVQAEDVALTADGRVLATVGKDKVRLWDATTGAGLAELSGGAPVVADGFGGSFPNEMIAVALAPDGKHVATAAVDEVEVWTGDGKTKLAVVPQTREHITRLVASPDSTRFAIASLDAIRIVDFATGKVVTSIDQWGGLEALAFDHDGTRLAGMYGGGETRVWDAHTGALMESWDIPGTEHTGFALAASAALVRDATDLMFLDLGTGKATVLASGPAPWRGTIDAGGTRAAVIGDLGDADVWSADGTHVLHLPARRGTFRNGWLSADGSRLVTSSDEGLAVWTVPDGKLVVELPEAANAIAFGPGDTIATAGNGAHIWYARSEASVIELVGHQEDITYVEFSPDGSTILTSSQDLTMRTWRARDGAPIGRQPATRSTISDATVIASDGSRVAGVTNWGVQVWTATGATEREIKAGLRGAAFDRDGHYAIGIGDAGGVVFDLATGAQLAVIHETMGAIVAAVGPSGDVVATGGYDGKAALWAVPEGTPRCRLDGRATGTEVYAFTNRDVSAIAFSPSGDLVAIGHLDGTISVRDARTCRERQSFAVPGGVGALELTASRLLAGGDDTVVWDLATGRELARRHSRKTYGRGAHLSHDGRVATSLTDGDEVELWEAASGRLLGTFAGHGAWTTALSPDGSQLVVAGHDKTARIYRVPTLAPVPAACRILVAHGDADTAKQVCAPGDLH